MGWPQQKAAVDWFPTAWHLATKLKQPGHTKVELANLCKFRVVCVCWYCGSLESGAKHCFILLHGLHRGFDHLILSAAVACVLHSFEFYFHVFHHEQVTFLGGWLLPAPVRFVVFRVVVPICLVGLFFSVCFFLKSMCCNRVCFHGLQCREPRRAG